MQFMAKLFTVLFTRYCLGDISKRFMKQSGDMEIIGLFPVRSNDPMATRNESLAWVEAMIYKINQINRYQGHDLFGFTIYDTYGVDDMSILTEALVDIMINSTDEGKCLCKPQNENFKKLIGIVGPTESISSISVHNLLSNEGIAIVSYFATSVVLNEKFLYPNFFRTMPPDSFQSSFMRDVIVQFNWRYVSLVASDDVYGRGGIDYLDKQFIDLDICINVRATLNNGISLSDVLIPRDYMNTTNQYIEVLKRIKLDKRSKVIIVWGWFHLVKNLLILAQRIGLFDYTWILSEATAFNPWLQEFSKSYKGNILLTVPTSGDDREFENYFLNLTYNDTKNKPWLQKFFHTHGINRVDSPVNIRDLSYYFEFGGVSFVENAVNVLVNSYLKFKPKRNDESYLINNRTKFNNIIKEINFTGFLNKTFAFNEFQNPSQAFFKLFLINRGNFLQIASWSSLNKLSNIKQLYFLANVTSICSSNCPAGMYALRNEDKKCCWKCVPCSSNYFKTTIGQETCKRCETEMDYYPSINKTSCIKLQRSYWQFNYSSKSFNFVVISLSGAAVGAILTIFILVTFTIHRHTHVVLSAHYKLSIFQQTIHLLLFAFPLLMLGEQTHLKCCLRAYLCGAFFTIIYTLTICKITEVNAIFVGKIKLHTRRDLIKIKSKLIVIFTVIILTYISTALVMENSWPLQIADRKNMIRYTIQKECQSRSFAIFHIVYSLAIFAGCAVQYFRGRKIFGFYNEAKYIAFAMFSSTMVTIVSIFIGNSLTDYDEYMFLLCAAVILSNLLILLISYSYRVYIIWLQPEENRIEHFRKTSVASIISSTNRITSMHVPGSPTSVHSHLQN